MHPALHKAVKVVTAEASMPSIYVQCLFLSCCELRKGGGIGLCLRRMCYHVIVS